MRKNPVQKIIYGKLMETYFAGDLKNILVKRISNMFAPHDLDFDNSIKLDACLEIIKSPPTQYE